MGEWRARRSKRREVRSIRAARARQPCIAGKMARRPCARRQLSHPPIAPTLPSKAFLDVDMRRTLGPVVCAPATIPAGVLEDRAGRALLAALAAATLVRPLPAAEAALAAPDTARRARIIL